MGLKQWCVKWAPNVAVSSRIERVSTDTDVSMLYVASHVSEREEVQVCFLVQPYYASVLLFSYAAALTVSGKWQKEVHDSSSLIDRWVQPLIGFIWYDFVWRDRLSIPIFSNFLYWIKKILIFICIKRLQICLHYKDTEYTECNYEKRKSLYESLCVEGWIRKSLLSALQLLQRDKTPYIGAECLNLVIGIFTLDSSILICSSIGEVKGLYSTDAHHKHRECTHLCTV